MNSEEMDFDLCQRFNEIKMPPDVMDLPRKELDLFFKKRGWLILVRRPDALYMRVVPDGKKRRRNAPRKNDK